MTAPEAAPTAPHLGDLRHHGDVDAAPGLLDLAVNVRAGTPPPWLRTELARAMSVIAAYPDARVARQAVAERYGRPAAEVLLTNGAAEAFVLLARALRPQRCVVVHPQFTEPELALRLAGHHVEQHVLTEAGGFRLDPAEVPVEADLVVLGNPTNPTSVLHPPEAVAVLARPGRVLVVDEAFADAIPGEAGSLAHRRDLPGLVVVRSLTKTWGLAGLRVGYVLAAAEVIGALADAQPHWAVSTPALQAAAACSTQQAVAEADAWATALVVERAWLAARLEELPEVTVVPAATGPFLLMRVPDGERVRVGLRAAGVAVRRGGTFPGLGPDWLRVAVRDRATSETFLRLLPRVLRGSRSGDCQGTMSSHGQSEHGSGIVDDHSAGPAGTRRGGTA